MTTLRRFGFFDALPVDAAVRELSERRRQGPDATEQNIMGYLKNGCQFLLSAGVAQDLLDPKRPIIGVPHVLTDGTWAWTSDVGYYVEKYHIRLPDDFLQHMVQNDWTCPRVADVETLRLEGCVT